MPYYYEETQYPNDRKSRKTSSVRTIVSPVAKEEVAPLPFTEEIAAQFLGGKLRYHAEYRILYGSRWLFSSQERLNHGMRNLHPASLKKLALFGRFLGVQSADPETVWVVAEVPPVPSNGLLSGFLWLKERLVYSHGDLKELGLL